MSQLKTVTITNKDNTGDPNITLYSDGSTDIDLRVLNTGPLAGFRNQLINGNFNIDQRGDVTITGANGYCVDRWVGPTSTSVKRISSNGYIVLQQLMADAAADSYVFQPIELPLGTNKAATESIAGPGPFVIGSTWTLSYYCDNPPTNVGTIVSWRALAQDGSTDLTAATVSTPTPTGKTIDSGDYGILTQYSTTFTISSSPRSTDRMLVIHLSGTKSDQGSGTVGNVWAYAQLEYGSVVTPYETIPTQTQLANCQRYYQIVRGGIMNDYASGAPAAFGGPLNFPTTMKSVPFEVVVVNVISKQNVTQEQVSNVSATGGMIRAVGITSDGGVSSQAWVADIAFNAEL